MNNYAMPNYPLISVWGNDGRELLTIERDGTVKGDVEDASEAARIFVEKLREYSNS